MDLTPIIGKPGNANGASFQGFPKPNSIMTCLGVGTSVKPNALRWMLASDKPR